jgi:hypothetical protein
MKKETKSKIYEAAFALVSAAEEGKVDGYRKQIAIEFLREIADKFSGSDWKERADKLEGGK